jgi:hypothetical protein
MSYQHSKSFEQLKGINESITGNLTTLQYLHTLDMFLWRALEPIHAECPSLFNNYLAKIVAQQSLNASTKFSSEEDRHARLPILLFNLLSESDPRKAHEHAKALHINRGILFGFISIFLSRLTHYEKLHSPFVKMDDVYRKSEMLRIEQEMGVRAGGSLYAALQQVRYWDEKARDFKGKIIQKYTRMAIMNAKLTYAEYNHYVKLDDVVQIYMLVVSRAIDRCDARQGVLTTFITNWFKSARSEVKDLAKSQTDQSYEQLSEEHGDSVSDIIGFSMPDTTSELEQHISYVAKQMDKQGYLRGPLHIPECVTKEQVQVLESLALD